MTHPIGEIVASIVLVLAIGASTLLVLPRREAETAKSSQRIFLDGEPAGIDRAEPVAAKTDLERVEDLERQLADLAAEQKQLSEQVKAIAEEVSRSGVIEGRNVR